MQPVGCNHCRRFNIRLAGRAKDFNHHPFGVIGPLGKVHDLQDDLVTHIDVFGIGVAHDHQFAQVSTIRFGDPTRAVFDHGSRKPGAPSLHHFDHTTRTSIASPTMPHFSLHHVTRHRAAGIFSGDVQVSLREWGGSANKTKATWVPLEPTLNLVRHRRQCQASPKDDQGLLFNHQIEALLEQVEFFIWHRKLISQDLKRLWPDFGVGQMVQDALTKSARHRSGA